VAGEFGVLHSDEIYNLFCLRNNITNAIPSKDDNELGGGGRCACNMNRSKQNLIVDINLIAKTEKRACLEDQDIDGRTLKHTLNTLRPYGLD
jgi:hypothetical protein